ncbi:MAG: BON domain-containing protein [Candidatus Binataceae bacterium]
MRKHGGKLSLGPLIIFAALLISALYWPFSRNALAGAVSSDANHGSSASPPNASSGGNVYRKGQQPLSDELLAIRVKTAISNDLVRVSVHNGVVTLKGKVASRHVAERAQNVAAHLQGVKGVRNRLTYPTHAH